MKTDYNIIIIGGGMVGMSLAYALSHLPMQIAVIDAVAFKNKQTTNFDARSISLAPASRNIFNQLGLWPDLEAHCTAIDKIHISDRGHFARTVFDAKQENFPALGYVIEAQHLTATLYSACKQKNNIHFIAPAKLIDLNCTDTQSNITIETDSKKQLTCQLLIAADGSHSTVRKKSGIDFKTWDYQQTALVANIGLARSHDNMAYERFTETGPLAMLPMSEQRAAMIWCLPHSQAEIMKTIGEGDFIKHLQKQFGYRLGRFIKVGKRHTFPLTMTSAEQCVAPGLILIGNAAQTLHPVSGQGFNLALRDIATLATILEKTDHAALSKTLEQFEKQSQWDQKRTMLLTDGLVRLYSNPYRLHTMIRGLCMLASHHIKPARKLLLRHTMGFGRVLV